jgi:hypothetical protein
MRRILANRGEPVSERGIQIESGMRNDLEDIVRQLEVAAVLFEGNCENVAFIAFLKTVIDRDINIPRYNVAYKIRINGLTFAAIGNRYKSRCFRSMNTAVFLCFFSWVVTLKF